jgi:shikimate dehydrogenase
MTDAYAVIGNPIAQSKSPFIHTLFAQQSGQDMVYSALLAPLDGFVDTVNTFRAANGRGMSVTAPFKLQAYDLATDRLERARLAGATNALKFDADRIWCDNFDGIGMINDVQRNLGIALAGKRVLMMGAGGAARGSMLPLLEQKPAELVVANRTVAKALALAEQFGGAGTVVGCGYPDLAGQRFDVILNATSASLTGELPALPAQACAGAQLAYEFVYGKGLTPFLAAVRAAGVGRLADGVGMLAEQAAEAFFWWRGVRPPTTDVIARLRVPLG